MLYDREQADALATVNSVAAEARIVHSTNGSSQMRYFAP